jgi:hypothetical protein
MKRSVGAGLERDTRSFSRDALNVNRPELVYP